MTKRKAWNLWLDDMRDPVSFLRAKVVEYEGYSFTQMSFPEFEAYLQKGYKAADFVWCKSAEEAITTVKNRGVPSFMALDHDLGNHDVFRFLKWLSTHREKLPPAWYCHSANPSGRNDVDAYMRSWHKVHGAAANPESGE